MKRLLEKRSEKRKFIVENFSFNNKKGQIWVETMIYTLIAFALIGLVLAFVKPKIQETQDKGVIEQSIGVLEDIDFIMRNLGGPGNQRVLQVGINKGVMTIDGANNTISFLIESRYLYSQPGQSVYVGDTLAYTNQKGNINEVSLIRNYSGQYDITVFGSNTVRELSKSATPYKIIISDSGGGKINMNVTN